MKNLEKTTRALLLPLCLLATSAAAADGPDWIGEPVTPTSFDGDVRSLPTAPAWKPGDPVREVPRLSFPSAAQAAAHAPADHPRVPDPLVGLQSAAPSEPTAIGGPIVNVAGQPYSGVNPPDVAGDVGPNHFIQSTNGGTTGSTFSIYNKTGTKLSGPTPMKSLGGSGACTSTFGDPIVTYDRLADRWFLLEFSTSAGKSLCAHVSKTGDPVSGGWWNYTFTQSSFPDYPHCSVWPDGYYCTANEGVPPVYVFDRVNMLAGLAARPQQTFRTTSLAGYAFEAMTAANLTGPVADPPAGSPAVLVRHHDDEAHDGGAADGTRDFLDLWTLHVDFATPASSSLSTVSKLPIAEYNSWFTDYVTYATVPQPNSPLALDPIREIIMNRMNYRNFVTHESIVGVFATNQDPTTSGSTVDSGLRWFELRRTPPGTGSWGLFQEGTFGALGVDTQHLLGAIAIDQSGDIALGYNNDKITSPYLYPSISYTGRMASDAAGTMTQGETLAKAGADVNSSARWGDYASMGIDPADDCTFWLTGQYQPGFNWATWITSFKFGNCGCAAPAGLSATVPADNRIDLSFSDSATATVTGYLVLRASSAAGPFSILTTIPDSSPGVGSTGSYLFSDTGVSGGTTYWYRIHAIGGGCTSPKAGDVSGLATGPCHEAPAFAGVASAVANATSTCGTTLSWAAGSPACGGSLRYDVFRSTTSGFIPGPANRVATGVTGTGWTDGTPLVSGATYYYVVRAEEIGVGVFELNAVERSVVVVGPPVAVTFSDDAGDTGSATFSVQSPWTVLTTGGMTGPKVYATGPYGANLCSALTSSNLSLGTGAVLSFASKYDLQGGRDAGIVQISTDGGSNWTKLTVVTYPDALTNVGNACGLPTGGSNTVFSRSIATPSYPASNYTADLSAYAGTTAKLRWLLSTDGNQPRAGWWIDDVSVTNTLVPGSCTSAPSGVPPVPDGAFVAGTAMKATRSAAGANLTWNVASCPAGGYAVVTGAIGSFGSLTGASCAIGASGSAANVALPADSFFVVVSTGSGAFGSFGRTGTGAEESFTGWSGLCPGVSSQSFGSCP